MKHWLRCRVTPGQFSDEYAVSAKQFNGTGFSLFAPHEYVICDSLPTESLAVEGWIRVQVYDQKDDHFLIRLPQEALEVGYYVTVRSDQLRTTLESQLVHDSV